MFDYLIDHAVKNVWCNPEQDSQYIVKPFRITSKQGALNYCTVMMRRIDLPVQKVKFHVYQIGQLHPLILGLFPNSPEWSNEVWIPFNDSINNQKMIVDVYTELGVQLPKFETYYMYNNDRDLIIAVKENESIMIDYSIDDIYIRVYSNAYFDSIRSDSTIDSVYTYGKEITSVNEILDLQLRYNSYVAKTGVTYAFVNGFLVDRIDPITVNVGDTVEFLYDSSILRTVVFMVDTLPVFDSILDSKRKYLLHYESPDNSTIYYIDDSDTYIIDEYATGRYYGVYYHHNAKDSARMVTHRDYSLPVAYFVHLTDKLKENAIPRILNLRTLKIQMNIRKSGYLRPLIFEHDRIHELYKLDDISIMNALLGIDSSVPNWRAEHLENSYYTKIMRSESNEITRDIIQDGYGYNSISKIIGETPSRTYLYSSRQQITVPYGLQQHSTAYEYDENGLMLGMHHHIDGSLYNAVDDNARIIEMISGIGDHYPDVRFGEDDLPLPTDTSYRVYMCHKTDIGYDEIWTDITGSDKYTIVSGKLKWSGLDFNQFLMVRTDSKFLAYDLNLVPIDGNLRFSLSEMEKREDIYEHYILPVPLGELDIFIEGKSLIENLDYYVQFPEIVIINKEYLKPQPNNESHLIHIRFTGFCNNTLTRDKPEDVGFIEHNVLSNNNRFDIRDDKVMRIVVDGRVKHRDALIFSELHSGVSIINTNNGKPYLIKDIVVPMKGLVNENTYTYRARSEAVDKVVSDYMTLKLPQPPRNAPSAIPKRYEVFSPFICKILYDIVNKHLPNEIFEKTLTNNEIMDICKPYENWLAFDPTQITITPNSNFVIIHPHNHYNVLTINLLQYRFIKRVVDMYCNGLVELSPFVAISQI